MIKEEVEYSIVVETDTYVGNIDSAILAAVFGVDDDRHGRQHLPLFDDNLYDEKEKEFIKNSIGNRPVEEYGPMPYELDASIKNEYGNSCMGLEVFLNFWDYNDKFINEAHVAEYFYSIIRTKAKREIEYNQYGYYNKFRILNFYSRKKTIKTETLPI